jgi:hypothetical protein
VEIIWIYRHVFLFFGTVDFHVRIRQAKDRGMEAGRAVGGKYFSLYQSFQLDSELTLLHIKCVKGQDALELSAKILS